MKVSFEDRLSCVRAAAERVGCTILLKGAETIIATPDGTAIINRNAPPWLATAGSGDVLAGMILGLVAQKMSLVSATSAAVWTHGRIATHHGIGLIAEDIVAGIPAVLGEIRLTG
jgi:NAD(P)H-hydrate epimerase